MFTSATQPHCRCCGKPIKKHVVTHYFGVSRVADSDWSRNHAEEAKTKADAQRYINHPIVSIRKGYNGNVAAGAWDGESYEGDGIFDSQQCAAAFGRMAAKLYPELQTQQAVDARKSRSC